MWDSSSANDTFLIHFSLGYLFDLVRNKIIRRKKCWQKDPEEPQKSIYLLYLLVYFVVTVFPPSVMIQVSLISTTPTTRKYAQPVSRNFLPRLPWHLELLNTRWASYFPQNIHTIQIQKSNVRHIYWIIQNKIAFWHV